MGGVSGLQPVRVLVVDGNATFRLGLKSILAAEDGIDVVGEVSDLSHVAACVAEEQPSAVLLGVDRVGAAEEAAIMVIAEANPTARIIVLGTQSEVWRLERLLRLGIWAYLKKDVPHRYLVSMLHVAHFDGCRMVMAQPAKDEDVVLSPREREVVTLVAEALTNSQIGERLSITEGTVKRHMRSIFVKLCAVSRIDAVNKAVEASIIT